MRKELENRLIKHSLTINRLTKSLDGSFLAQHISTQISLTLLSESVRKDKHPELLSCQKECDQLIAINHTTVMSAKKNT